MITNQNRLTPIFRFFLFDKFKGNTLLHNVLKDLVLSMSLYPSIRQLSKPALEVVVHHCIVVPCGLIIKKHYIEN